MIAAGGSALLILPIDLPTGHARGPHRGSWTPSPTRRRPLVAIVPDRHGRGTNALLLAPPDVIDVRFGGDSRGAHIAAAAAAGARLVELDGPLTDDLDTPEDLLLAQSHAPGSVGG